MHYRQQLWSLLSHHSFQILPVLSSPAGRSRGQAGQADCAAHPKLQPQQLGLPGEPGLEWAVLTVCTILYPAEKNPLIDVLLDDKLDWYAKSPEVCF